MTTPRTSVVTTAAALTVWRRSARVAQMYRAMLHGDELLGEVAELDAALRTTGRELGLTPAELDAALGLGVAEAEQEQEGRQP